MPISANDATSEPRSSGWSNRILLAAIAGILFLTLYPFRLSLHPHVPLKSSPFLLGSGLKRPSALDFSLNVLLFIPFGFGLCSKLRGRNWTWTLSLAATSFAGAAFSYVIEFTQIYIPVRDSGWEDIFSNTTGSVLGGLIFVLAGANLLRLLAGCEEHLESSLSAKWTWSLLLAYFAVWFAISIPLQRQTSLTNWVPNAYLLIGNDGSLSSPWKGEMLHLQIWARPLPGRIAEAVSSQERANDAYPPPLADYDFSTAPPIQDRQGLLSDLSWASRERPGKAAVHPSSGGGSWMMSQSPVEGLIEALRNTNQFTVRIVCRPPKIAGEEGAILSISQPPVRENLGVWQDGPNLRFWFRSPLTANFWRLSWSVSDAFIGDEPRDILISYDGSNVSVFVDGKKDRRSTQLGPGVALAKLFHRGKPGEVQIYNDIYYLAVFFPAGCLLGIFERKVRWGKLAGPLLVSLLLAPLLLEKILVDASGRPYSYSNLALSCILVAVAALWINADQPPKETDGVSKGQSRPDQPPCSLEP